MERIPTGALAGWKPVDMGSRVMLHLQIMHRDDNEENEVSESVLMMDRNQAVLLANSLYELTGQSKPRRRTLLQSLFGT